MVFSLFIQEEFLHGEAERAQSTKGKILALEKIALQNNQSWVWSNLVFIRTWKWVFSVTYGDVGICGLLIKNLWKVNEEKKLLKRSNAAIKIWINAGNTFISIDW